MGSFTLIDMIAATTNALNGGLLAQRPDHYKGNYWTIVGLLGFAVIGGIGGGITRDVLLAEVPDALTKGAPAREALRDLDEAGLAGSHRVGSGSTVQASTREAI